MILSASTYECARGTVFKDDILRRATDGQTASVSEKRLKQSYVTILCASSHLILGTINVGVLLLSYRYDCRTA